MSPTHRAIYWVTGFAVFLLSIIAPASANEQTYKYQYAAKVVCGNNPMNPARILPGRYATTVNIFNPTSYSVEFAKSLSLTFPPAEQAPGRVSEALNDRLEPMQALKVACRAAEFDTEGIPTEFFGSDIEFPPYVEGFLVIRSNRPLVVSTVYTAGPDGEPVQSIDVEPVTAIVLDK
ncbi:MAG: hypothetical protein OEU26_36885 [Candidatus Tectomicrobia bacterium]|nr:hypothetical protein [Candidatus Tectomicrobia bacterium]